MRLFASNKLDTSFVEITLLLFVMQRHHEHKTSPAKPTSEIRLTDFVIDYF